VLEVFVPVGQRLAAPADKNDAYEEMLYGIESILAGTAAGTPFDVGPRQAMGAPEKVVHRFERRKRG
jgi:hypothetical protein